MQCVLCVCHAPVIDRSLPLDSVNIGALRSNDDGHPWTGDSDF